MAGQGISTICKLAAGMLLVLGSCQSIPDDYPPTQGLRQRLGNLHTRILDPEIPESAARRLQHAGSTGGAIAEHETRALRKVPSSLRRNTDNELMRVSSTGRNFGSAFTSGLANSGRRLSRLARYPAWATSRLNKRFSNLRSFGDRLRLNRPILPMPGDESRLTEILGEGRPAGLLERIFARIRP